MLRIKVCCLAPVTEQNHNRVHTRSTVCTRNSSKGREQNLYSQFSSLNCRETKETITLREHGRTGNYFLHDFDFLHYLLLLILAVKANIDLCLGCEPSIFFGITSLGLNYALFSFRCICKCRHTERVFLKEPKNKVNFEQTYLCWHTHTTTLRHVAAELSVRQFHAVKCPKSRWSNSSKHSSDS